MPVTPTFSEDFYKKLGHGTAEEFVNWFNQAHIAFRTDLKELNELNYARFESKLEQRIVELRATLREELAQMGAALRQEIAALDANLSRRIAELDTKLSRRIAELDTKLSGQIAELDAKLSGQIASVEARGDKKLATLQAEVQSLKTMVRWLFGFWAASTVTILAAIIRLAGT
jgi:DNA anti-recombination protein RmuC